MSHLDAYIGDRDDPNFDWNHDVKNGGLPKRISPFIIDGFTIIKERIENGKYFGKQTDWAGWTGVINKKEIQTLLNFLYKNYREKYKGLPHIIKQIDEIKEFVEKLDDKKTYYIVACEL